MRRSALCGYRSLVLTCVRNGERNGAERVRELWKERGTEGGRVRFAWPLRLNRSLVAGEAWEYSTGLANILTGSIDVLHPSSPHARRILYH
jgi:hypothetical protein